LGHNLKKYTIRITTHRNNMVYCVYREPENFAIDESIQRSLMTNAIGEIVSPPLPPSEATQQPLHGSSTLQQQQQQQQLAEVDPSHEIRPTDVLCSRDKASHSHPGNKRFRQLIVRSREQYQNLSLRDDKTRLTTDIVNAVKSYGGRFLKQHESTGSWYEVTYNVAHEKVSHALRSAKDPNRPKPRASRTPIVKPPTHDEDRQFESLAREQQQLFSVLTTTTPSRMGKTGKTPTGSRQSSTLNTLEKSTM
jgi:hypothetical protein